VAGVDSAKAVLGLAEEFLSHGMNSGSAAQDAYYGRHTTSFNIHYTGSRDTPDLLVLSGESTQ
jgi:hypothetical protein